MSAAMYLCVTCGTQYPVEDAPPAHCPICEDERQYVNRQGQQWTTLARLRAAQPAHTNTLTELLPGVTSIATNPKVGIGQRALLLRTPAGNLLWDCLAYLDDATVEAIHQRGGLAAIAISHPHFYTTMVDWSHAFGGVPIHIHADNRPFVSRPDPVIQYFEGESVEPLPGLRVLRLGGHFPGSAVLHWPGAAEGAGALFTGDTIKVVADPRWVTFMYSYPNDIPLGPSAIRRIVAAVEPLSFARLYDGWDEVEGDARDAVLRSAGRYLAHITEA